MKLIVPWLDGKETIECQINCFSINHFCKTLDNKVIEFPQFPRHWPWPPAPATNLYLLALPPNFYFLALAPICIHQPWLRICIYGHWPTMLLPVRGLSLHVPTLTPQFVFVFTALVYDLYYRSGTWICIYLIIGSSSSGSSNYSSSNFFGTNNINILVI